MLESRYSQVFEVVISHKFYGFQVILHISAQQMCMTDLKGRVCMSLYQQFYLLLSLVNFYVFHKININKTHISLNKLSVHKCSIMKAKQTLVLRILCNQFIRKS